MRGRDVGERDRAALRLGLRAGARDQPGAGRVEPVDARQVEHAQIDAPRHLVGEDFGLMGGLDGPVARQPERRAVDRGAGGGVWAHRLVAWESQAAGGRRRGRD